MNAVDAQKYRLRVPEPSSFPWPVIAFPLDHIPRFFDTTPCFYGGVGEFKKKLLSDESGTKFWAWTVDGHTPVFPIPQEQE